MAADLARLEPKPLAALDLVAKEFETMLDVHNPGLLRVDAHAKLLQDLHCTRERRTRFCCCFAGDDPVIRPPCEPVTSSAHLLVERRQQDVAQQR
jgi:hypothetical protein